MKPKVTIAEDRLRILTKNGSRVITRASLMDLITIESRIIVPEIESVTVGTTRIKAPGVTEEMITMRSTAIPGTINLTGANVMEVLRSVRFTDLVQGQRIGLMTKLDQD